MMKNSKNIPPSRRRFLTLGFLAGGSILTGKAETVTSQDNGEKVKMLTQEGKLVEVDKAAIVSNAQKTKASKMDIMKWVHKNN
jgi:hypothetical protein